MSDSFRTAIEIAMYVVMAGVVVALFMGVGSMYRGGKDRIQRSNVLMRWRVGLQLVAIVLLAILVYVAKK